MNRFKPGDRVRFLNDVGNGVVKYLRGDKQAVVETTDGFEIPVNTNELVPDGNLYEDGVVTSGKNNKTENKPKTSKEKESKPEKTEKGNHKPEILNITGFSERILVAVVPADGFAVTVSDMNLYLINDSQWNILFVISAIHKNKNQLIRTGKLESASKLLFSSFSQTRISQENIRVDYIFYKKEPFVAPEPASKVIELTKIPFYKQKSFSKSGYFEEPVVEFTLYSQYADNQSQYLDKEILSKIQQDTAPSPTPPVQGKDNNAPQEIDLHIEVLMEDHKDLSPTEILNVQMDHFRRNLEDAMESGKKRIVFIHGVGNGRLKFELRKNLDEKYAHLKYQDASFQEYGFGATLVFLKE